VEHLGRAVLPPCLCALLLLASASIGQAAQEFLLHDKGCDRQGYYTDPPHLYRLRLEPHDVVVVARYRTRYGREGRKQYEGDGRTPEGKYHITDVRPRNRWDYDSFGPWSLRISYPNKYDRRRDRPGSNILIHGGHDSSTNGCIRVLDDGYRTFGRDNITKLAGTTEQGTPIISAAHVPRFLKGPPERHLGAEAAAFYRRILQSDLDNDTVITRVARFDPYRSTRLAGYSGDDTTARRRSPPPRPARPTVQPPPKVVKVTASSYLHQIFGPDCRPENLLDNKTNTAWCEGKKGDGEGAWVEIVFDRPVQIRGFTIVNGYDKGGSFDRWEANGRVHTLELAFDGKSYNTDLENKRVRQRRFFENPPRARRMRLIIRSVYRGKRYRDTCLSEVEIDYGS